MTLDDYDERAELSYVINMCNKNLTSQMSDEVCQQLAQSVKMETSSCEGVLRTPLSLLYLIRNVTMPSITTACSKLAHYKAHYMSNFQEHFVKMQYAMHVVRHVVRNKNNIKISVVG